MTDIGYTTTDELQRVLKIRDASEEQVAAFVRVLTSAYVEILSEIDLADGVTLTDDQTQLAAEVQIERGVEHWQQSGTYFGLMGIDDRGGGTFVARDSWDRHALKLAPLKGQWGIA
jgi:hypothetical protein